MTSSPPLSPSPPPSRLLHYLFTSFVKTRLSRTRPKEIENNPKKKLKEKTTKSRKVGRIIKAGYTN